MSHWRGFLVGWIIIVVGVGIAHFVQTSADVTVKDVRFSSAMGKTLSALLYLPPDASPTNKAPGILAVHGYINSREVQSGFAIEFARRGYVVLALDQIGHGYSDPPAFSEGFGGPDALVYLRSLDMVDTANIGLEGHSMGGWAVLAAAAAMPDAYRSVVLQGSSTGPPFAIDGTASWPRNVAVVFSQFDEFAELMWGVRRALDVAQSKKLQTLFATSADVIADKVYGDINAGTARILHQPAVTHPGDHISHTAIGHAIDWFSQTLDGAHVLPPENQIWFIKEIGTLIALIGLVVLILGSVQILLQLKYFQVLKTPSQTAAYESRSLKWWCYALLGTIIPVATFYPFFGWAETLMPPSAWFPQGITNQVLLWALANGVIAAVISRLSGSKTSNHPHAFIPSLALALTSIAIACSAVFLADVLFTVDFRFWFVGVKMLSLLQFKMALIYLAPFTVYFVLALRALHNGTSVRTDSWLAAYSANAFIMMGGFLFFLIFQYAYLFGTGSLLTPDEPLNTIVMIQFVPLLFIVAVISTFTHRRTGSYLPGAFINGLFVTWYIVAGQATQFA